MNQEPAVSSRTAPSGDALTRAQALLREALDQYPAGTIALSFSGAEDVVLLDLIASIGYQVDVFSLDTGRLHPETYEFIERVRKHYDCKIELLMPKADDVQRMVRQKGLFSFYQEGHGECCEVRKIAPLRSKLSTLDAWITGQRRDQSVTRSAVPERQRDLGFSTNDHSIEKFNPLADWSSAEVWAYIRAFDVPYNALHDKGFVSIGCQPCTRTVGPHEHERGGRWWWEEATQKECGLHGANLITSKSVA